VSKGETTFSGGPAAGGKSGPALAPGIAILACFALLATACAPLRDFFLPSPGVPREWAALVDEVRAFEHRIGFDATHNFVDFSAERGGFPFCARSSRLILPYSYQDPAIEWRGSVTEEECRALADGADTYFTTVEAVGEIETPVTAEMISSKLARFLYLVIHEDCHDQFELPYGIEEALCDLITHKAMAAFTDEKFGSYAREDRAIRRYAEAEAKRARATVAYYEELARLYARHERNEITGEVLLKERAAILARAERALAWTRGPLNNIGLATDMTYSRHYPFVESVFDALGRDLPRTVAFFKHADRIKPSHAAVMKRHRIADERSAAFIRAYEAAVVDTIRKALADAQRQKN
jgi:hypothetical protein